MVLTGEPAGDAAAVLEQALGTGAPADGTWDTKAALLWSLVTAERFATVEAALHRMCAAAHGSGSARGLVAVYSTQALLQLRLGALPDADAAARVALTILEEADLTPGVVFGISLRADISVESGELDEAGVLLARLPDADLPPGVGTVLVPAARGRWLTASGRPVEALAQFRTCLSMFGQEAWGLPVRDAGYLHARSGAAHALLLLDRRDEAVALAGAELADARAFGAPRAIGVAARALGLAIGGTRGMELLAESVDTLRTSPAVLERAKSLAELGSALRRAGWRVDARAPLGEALDLASRCGARPLVARTRHELHASGGRPRRERLLGVEALTPSERRVVALALAGRTNREIAHALYVTLKTVERHLAHAYGKLGVSSRVELRERVAAAEVEGAHPVV